MQCTSVLKYSHNLKPSREIPSYTGSEAFPRTRMAKSTANILRLRNLLILSSGREYICCTWRQCLCNAGGRQIEDGDKNPHCQPPHLPRLWSEFSDTKTNSLTLSKLSLPALADLERGSMWPSPSLTQPQIWWLRNSLAMERAETG